MVNNVAIESTSQSVKNWIQAIMNRPNNNDINMMLMKMTGAQNLATSQENTQNTTTIKELVAEINLSQKHTSVKVTTGRKTTTCIPTAQELPSLRHNPR